MYMCLFFYYFFFFSSRRRHTRLTCDWSSDVCSSARAQTPFDKPSLNKAGEMVYQKAFARGLAWIPAGHILRMSPPVVMEDECLLKGLDMIDEAIGETEKELGF